MFLVEVAEMGGLVGVRGGELVSEAVGVAFAVTSVLGTFTVVPDGEIGVGATIVVVSVLEAVAVFGVIPIVGDTVSRFSVDMHPLTTIKTERQKVIAKSLVRAVELTTVTYSYGPSGILRGTTETM